MKTLPKLGLEEEEKGNYDPVFDDPSPKIGGGYTYKRPYNMIAAVMAHLVLLPSPGERFWLVFQCLDQVLNEVPSTMLAKVGLPGLCLCFLMVKMHFSRK